MKNLVFILIIFLLSFHFKLHSQSLRINEVCSSNTNVIADHLGNHEDWIELKNTSSGLIDLNLYYLSDSQSNITKFRFPVGSYIAPNEIILVWAVNNVTPIINPYGDYWGTNFAVSAAGEPVVLSYYDSISELIIVVDFMPVTAIPSNYSFGRIGDNPEWYYFASPTPREDNNTPAGVLSDPIASLNSGWYPDSLAVNFTSSDPGAQIRYTIDGSDPTLYSPLWTGEMYLHDKSSEPNQISLIPTNLPYLPEPVNELDWWFPPAITVPKIHTIKARCFATGLISSNIVTRTYMVGIDLYDLPIVSVIMDSTDLFDPDTGIYVAGSVYESTHYYFDANFMQDWERPIITDWFDCSGNNVYQKSGDTEIHGTYSSRAGMKSLRLETSGIAPDILNYPFFGTDYQSSFRYLILRNSGNDIHKTLFRDNLVEKLLKGQNLDVANFTPYIVFLNGEYWGIHTLQERMREYFVSEHYDIPVSELDVLEDHWETNCGDNLDYIALLDYLELNDVTNPSVWQYLETKIDMNNLCEYMAGEIIAGNTDWLGNNIRYWRKRVPYTSEAPYGHDGRWRWLVYDMDFSIGLYQHPYWEHNTLWYALDPAREWRTFLLRNLIQNQGFKSDFINTLADRLNYNWKPSTVISLIDSLENQFATSIPMHINRWCLPEAYGLWQGEVERLRTFATNRPAFLRNLVVSQFGLDGLANVSLQINPPEAAMIRINDRVDLTSGDYVYFQGNPINLKAVVNPGWEIVTFGDDNADLLTINPIETQTIVLVLQRKIPQNLLFLRNGNNLELSWDLIPEAVGFVIETSDSPTFTTWEIYQTIIQNYLSIFGTDSAKFYRVKAIY